MLGRLYLILMLLLFVGLAYIGIMSAGTEMTRLPTPNYSATPMSRR